MATASKASVVIPKQTMLEHTLALTQMALARIAARAGWKVLQYTLQPGERTPWPGCAAVVVVHPPDGKQLAFPFDAQHASMLSGIPQSSVYPVQLKDISEESFEKLVRAALAVFPGAIADAPMNPWNGTDGSDASHADLLQRV